MELMHFHSLSLSLSPPNKTTFSSTAAPPLPLPPSLGNVPEMAAYAALVSLSQLINQLQHHRPHPPISLEKEQTESLTAKINSLQKFLEGYTSHVGYSKEADGLERRIAEAAYTAEDIIESQIVDQILVGSTSQGRKRISSLELHQGLEKVMEDMDLIKKDVIQIQEKMGVQNKLERSSPRSSSTRKNVVTAVGLDDVVYEVTDRLAGGETGLQIIPIVGMGGIGKTTLARTVYSKPVIKHYFDICAWATVSQEYNVKDILNQVFNQDSKKGKGDFSDMSVDDLGEMLYKHLSGRRYLIVMDDIWNIEVWYRIKFFFPDYRNGSRIIVTTRLSNLASQLTALDCVEMKFLDEFTSWNLFSKTVFGEESCPLELEEIGKKIVKNCRGLPLSVVVIGGFLAKSEHSRESWEYVEENLNSIVNSDDDGSCLKILHMSYNQLPVYLKPCFLYMGVFPEDDMIRVALIVKLWAAEGFLKPINGKSSEVVAKEYLKDLIDRNLILVDELGLTGNIKFCNIHDLLRDLCLREAQKEGFYDAIRQHGSNFPQSILRQRRVVIPQRLSSEKDVSHHLQSLSHVRSVICDNKEVAQSLDFRVLRMLKLHDRDATSAGDYMFFLESMLKFVNLRYLAVKACSGSVFPSSASLLWNLQTLIVFSYDDNFVTAPVEIWNMPQLRHIDFCKGIYLPDPPSGKSVSGEDGIVLHNLQTLTTVGDFKCSEEVVKRTPNVKKLGVEFREVEGSSPYNFENLYRLNKLESFYCRSCRLPPPSGTDWLRTLIFPRSLKKLRIIAFHVHWEDLLEKIGSLPLLEKLSLTYGYFKSRKWETIGGQFPNLKFLQLDCCDDLEHLTIESSHFPRLEYFLLEGLEELKEIPSDIGDIPTLKLIQLIQCSDPIVISARRILDEREEFGEEGLRVRVSFKRKNQAMEDLAGPYFQVEYD